MAATSLARQLQQLSVPGQPSIRQVTSKTRPSFLFEGREAGDIDVESVYHIGCSGLQELGSMDSALLPFRGTLFSEDCKEYDRSSSTKEELASLDEELGRFLLHLSPYFLLKPAHWCLEWLVRAFRVHSCNVDQVMECILPYYQTGHFVRMVQLLPIKSHSSPWHWLRPIQKSGKPLANQTLINHCLSDHAFLVFICELTIKSVHLHRHRPTGSHAAVALYTSAMVGSLEQAGSVSEELVTVLAPYLTKGLRSKNKDLCAACLSVAGLLCSQTQLSNRLVESLLGTLAKHVHLELQHEQLQCMSLVCTTQEVKTLPAKAAKHLLNWSGLVESLDELTHTASTSENFVESLLRALVKDDLDEEAVPTASDVLLSAVSQLHLRDAFAKELVKCVLSMCVRTVQEGKSGDFPSTQHPFTPVLQSLSRRYSTSFDKAVSSLLLRDGATQSEMWSALQHLLSTTLPTPRHQLLSNTCGTVSLALHHREGSVRALAVQQLGKVASEGQLSAEDKDFVSSSVLLRLKDDDRSVVRAVLDLSTGVFDLVPPTDLIEGLMGIIRERKWEDCAVKALTLVSSISGLSHLRCDSVDKLVTELAACLLLTYKTWKTSFKMATSLAESALSSTHPLLKGLTTLVCCEEWQKLSDGESPVAEAKLVDANVAYLGWLTDNLATMDPVHKERVIGHLLRQSAPAPTKDTLSVYICSNFVLSHFIRVTEDHQLQLKVAAILSQNIHANSVLLAEQDPTEWQGAHLPQTPFPVMVFLLRKPKQSNLRHLQVHLQLWVMNIIINHLAPPPLEASVWLSLMDSGRKEDMFHFAILGVLTVLTTLAGGDSSHPLVKISQQLLKNFCQVHFSGRGWLLRFLALVWTAKTDSHFSIGNVLGLGPVTLPASALLQARVLHIGAAYLSALDVESLVAICSQTCPLIPSLLIPLHNPLKVLRNGAMACLKVIHDAVDGLPHSTHAEALMTAPMLHLVIAIVQHSFDIASDPDYLPNVLRKLFSKKETKGTPLRLRCHDREGSLPALSNVMSVVGQTDAPPWVKAALLRQLCLVHHPIKVSACAALLRELVELDRESLTGDEDALLSALLSGYTPGAAGLLGACPDAMAVFVDVLRGKNMRGTPCQLQALQQVTPEFYQSLSSPSLQGEVLKVLLDATVDSTDTSFVTTARSVMQQFPLSSEVLVCEMLERFTAMGGGATSQAKRRKRVDMLPGNSERSCKLVQILLEVANSAPLDLEGEGHLLVPPLFVGLEHCLDKLEGEGQEEGQGWEYTCQLIFSLLLQWCNKMAAMVTKGVTVVQFEEQFNVELVVQAIRVSSSTQTHHTAYLLLGATAKVYPSRVLHNIMPIFTFMGDNMLRRDDRYSLQVIQQTLDSVVPVIMRTGNLLAAPKPHPQTRHKTKSSPSPMSMEDTVIELLTVFVDTLPHVPPHRRAPLFAHLLQCLGPEHHLHRMWALLARRHSSAPAQRSKESSLNYLEFACQLVEGLPVAAILSAILKLTQYTMSLPLEKPPLAARKRGRVIFDPASHSTKQLLHFQYTIYHLMGGAVGGAGLAQKLSDLVGAGGHLEVEKLILQLLEALLSASTMLREAMPTDELVGKYLGSVQRKVQEVIVKVTNLLSLGSFLEMVGQLITGSSPPVQQQALGLLVPELSSPREVLSNEHKQQLVHMMGAIRVVATSNQCSSTNQIAAMHCIKEASKVIAQTSTKEFVAISKDLVGILAQQSAPTEVVQASLHCLSEVLSQIGAHLIPLLSDIVPAVLLRVDIGADSVVLTAAISTLSTVVTVLAKFISPYLQWILLKVCSLPLPATPGLSDAREQLHHICHQLGRLVPLRVLLPALPLAYRELEGGDKGAVLCWCDIVQASTQEMLPSDVKTYQPALLELFFTALDYRTQHSSDKPMDQVAAVEERCVSLFGSLVLKMSEATFRPAFLKLFEWATHKDGHDSGCGSGCGKRVITFYHVTTEVASVLKGIFLLFAGHILPKCAELLTCLHSDKGEESVFPDVDQCSVLLSYVLRTLHKCFLSDKGQFVTKERFDILLQALTDQVTSTLGGEDEVAARVEDELVPCIAELGAASGRDVLWKQLNQKLLHHSRHRSPQVRLTVIKVVKGFYSKLGEEFMVLLPETIPYLSELMEDESEEVEKACHQLIASIEDTLGESLQQYLSAS